MKKHEISKLVAGVAFGIMIAMLLILRVLGKTWDNIAVSILIGSLAGITLYDYRIITTSVRSAIAFVKEKMVIKIGIRKGTFWPFLINSTIAIVLITALAYLGPGSNPVLNTLIIVTLVCYPFLILTVSCFVLLFIEDKKVVLKSRFIKKIESLAIDVFEGNNYDDNGKASYQIKCALKIGWEWYRFIPNLFIITLLSISMLLAIFLQAIVSVFLFIGFLFKLLGQNKSVILITLAVTVGTLAGVWQESYFIGLLSGLLFLGLNLMFGHIEINPKILFEKRYNLAGRIMNYL